MNRNVVGIDIAKSGFQLKPGQNQAFAAQSCIMS